MALRGTQLEDHEKIEQLQAEMRGVRADVRDVRAEMRGGFEAITDLITAEARRMAAEHDARIYAQTEPDEEMTALASWATAQARTRRD